jgi:general stress protein YciG
MDRPKMQWRKKMERGGTHEQHAKAGQQSHKNNPDQKNMSREAKGSDEHRGGSGNFAEDRERASDAGRKGGQH